MGKEEGGRRIFRPRRNMLPFDFGFVVMGRERHFQGTN